MARYFAILDGKPGAFGVSFPDLPGCVAMGKDENEAYSNALDALANGSATQEWTAMRQSRARSRNCGATPT